jgi:hypothetical protein
LKRCTRLACFQRHTAASSVQSCTCRPAGRQSLKRQTSPAVTPLVAGAGKGSLQADTDDLQSSRDWPASVSIQSLHHQHTPVRLMRRPRLDVPHTRTEFGKRTFIVAAPPVWNELPESLRQCRNLTTFKKHLKTCLFNEAFHPYVY